MKKFWTLNILYISVLMLLGIRTVFCEDLRQVIDLSGWWKFEIGDRPEYAEPGFNDESWEEIKVPSNWEDQGFPGYDGYAWYRLTVFIPKDLSNKSIILKLGRIDDVDEVYINGQYVGSTGIFPPNYQTAWSQSRTYYVPNSYLLFGDDNVIAVKVYDSEMGGGLVSGPLGMYTEKYALDFIVNLTGTWKFKLGDRVEWRSSDLDDSNWSTIMVPSTWESQGYSDYDGFAWYRKQIKIDNEYARAQLIFVLGKIDDSDEFYFNGELVGGTGGMPNSRRSPDGSTAYGAERFYAVPRSLVRANQMNQIAIRVYDSGGVGGMYQGPLGVITRQEYLLKKRR